MGSKLRKKSRSSGPLNVQNFQVQQIAQNVGVKVENLQIWIDAREKEMREALIRLQDKEESEEKRSFIPLWKGTGSHEKDKRDDSE